LILVEHYDVSVERRTPGGKKELKRLKRNGFIPGILYNQGESIPVSVEEDQIKSILNNGGEDVLLNLHFNGSDIKAVVREVQRDPVTKDIQHIDLMPLKGEYLH